MTFNPEEFIEIFASSSNIILLIIIAFILVFVLPKLSINPFKALGGVLRTKGWGFYIITAMVSIIIFIFVIMLLP